MIQATFDSLMADVTASGRPALALCIKGGSAVGHFARFVVDEHLCDGACYGEPHRFFLVQPVDRDRAQRLLDIYNAWPWPTEEAS
jgi:hypothetical protein